MPRDHLHFAYKRLIQLYLIPQQYVHILSKQMHFSKHFCVFFLSSIGLLSLFQPFMQFNIWAVLKCFQLQLGFNQY